MSTAKTQTPELDKQLEFIKDGTTQTLSEFYDWLESRGYHLMRWEEQKDFPDCKTCSGTGTVYRPNTHRLAGWSAEHPETLPHECVRCAGKGYLVKVIGEDWEMYAGGPEQLFADFLGIDRDKIEAERRALLDEIRESNDSRG